MTPERHYRCQLCGHLLPAWLPVAKRVDSAMLLHHLGIMHPAEAGPYLRRMERVEYPQIMSTDLNDLRLLGTFGEDGRRGCASIGAGPESWMAGA